MIVNISSDAEADIADGFWFYEGQEIGLGDYFRSSIIADIESLAIYGGIHEQVYGYHRTLTRRFPFTIYYRCRNVRCGTRCPAKPIVGANASKRVGSSLRD